MTHVWQVAKRDYIETVRSSSFIITLLIVPALIIVSIALPRLLERTAEPSKFALVNLPDAWTRQIYELYKADEEIHKRLILETKNNSATQSASQSIHDVESQVIAAHLYGFVTAEPSPEGGLTPTITIRVRGDDDGLRWLKRSLPALVRSERAAKLGLSSEQVAQLDAPIQIPDVLLEKSGEKRAASDTDRLAAYAPAIFTYMLWIVTFTLVQRLIMSTIEEKSNRTIELILSSVSPMEFMAGKVLGGVLEGLTVLLAWLATFYLAADYFTHNYLKGLDLRVLFAHKDQLVFFGVYFALGFILFAALVVGLGSLCNTIKDTQGLMTPVMLTMMVPIFVMTYVGSHPNTRLSIILSWIPFLTPFLMMNRIAANPPPSALEVAGSFALLLLAIYGTTWAGAKLFRVGILLYGKRPSLPEVVKILRTPEGRAAARVT